MSRQDLLDIMLDSMSANDIEITDRVVSENMKLIEQVFTLAGVDRSDDMIHVSQYEDHIETARQLTILKSNDLLN